MVRCEHLLHSAIELVSGRVHITSSLKFPGSRSWSHNAESINAVILCDHTYNSLPWVALLAYDILLLVISVMASPETPLTHCRFKSSRIFHRFQLGTHDLHLKAYSPSANIKRFSTIPWIWSLSSLWLLHFATLLMSDWCETIGNLLGVSYLCSQISRKPAGPVSDGLNSHVFLPGVPAACHLPLAYIAWLLPSYPTSNT